MKRKFRVNMTCFKNVQPEQIHWLWEGRIAIGKLTLISGDPGLGKSLLSVMLASHVSTGRPWPVDGLKAPLGDVILLSAEDDPADTIRPRLDAARADCSRVHHIKSVDEIYTNGTPQPRTFSLKDHVGALAEHLESLPECRLLVIDPISEYLGDADSNKNADVRSLLAPLSELARAYQIAVVVISHFNKSSGSSAMYRTTGSLGFVGAARTVYIVTKDKENPNRRLWLPLKNNIAKDTMGLAYSIATTENGQPLIAWESLPVEITASEALAQPDSNEDRTETDWAADFLEDYLANGSKLAVETKKEAQKAGINEKALRRARDKLGIKPIKSSFGGGWVWALPVAKMPSNPQDAPSEMRATSPP